LIIIGWVVSVNECVNEFKGILDHYLRDNRGLKKVMITLSSLQPFALSSLLLAAVLGKLGFVIKKILITDLECMRKCLKLSNFETSP